MAKRKKIHVKARHKGQEKFILFGERLEGPASPSPHALLYGKHAVLSALANPQRHIRRLLLTPERHESLIGDVDQALNKGSHSNIKILTLDKRKIEELIPPGAVHQGIGLEAEALQTYYLEDIISQTSENAEEKSP